MKTLALLLSSQTRAELFRLLFGLGESRLHLREMERRAAMSIGAVRQEIENLLKMGLVTRSRDGNRTYYQANQAHPLFPEIRGIVLKTCGLTDVLERALGSESIRCAFVFGSIASGKETAESDVDLMVIGELGLRQLTKRLAGIGEKLGREVNPHVLSPAEWNKRRQGKDHFVSSVISSPKLFIVGSAHELAAMG